MESTRKTSSFLLIGLFVVFSIATMVGFWKLKWQLDVASEHGQGVDHMINFLLIATGIMFAVGHLVTAWFIWGSSRGGRVPFRQPSRKAEWIATIIPVSVVVIVAEAGVLIIGMPVFAQIYHEDPDAIQVEIVGKQFEWISRYPGPDGVFGRTVPKLIDEQENPLGLDESDPAAKDDIVIRGAIYLPAGRNASIRIRSHDVLHSFTIPIFRLKQDAVPGFPQRTHVRPTKPGKYEIACAQLCGMGHYKMRGWCNVMTPEDFKKWLDSQTGWFE